MKKLIYILPLILLLFVGCDINNSDDVQPDLLEIRQFELDGGLTSVEAETATPLQITIDGQSFVSEEGYFSTDVVAPGSISNPEDGEEVFYNIRFSYQGESTFQKGGRLEPGEMVRFTLDN